MFNWLAPPIAFLVYLALAGALVALGRLLAGVRRAPMAKSSTYAGGEAPPLAAAAPGYGSSFVMALLFAVLHLGTLVLATGPLSPGAALFLAGLALGLVVLVIG